MPGRKRGTTLIEVMISISIVAVLMIVIADLVTRYSLVVSHQEKKDRALANVKMALDTVTNEIEEALGVYSPDTDGEQDTGITFYRYNPEQADSRIDKREGIYVRYYLDGGTLFREITSFTGTMACPIAHDVSGFSVRRESMRLFTVSVSLQEANRVYSIDSKACLKTGI